MDCITPILEIASRLWDCGSNHAAYISELSENLESLRSAMNQLKKAYEDLKEKVELQEKQRRKRTRVVGGWIDSVEIMLEEVDQILAKGDKEIQKRCLGNCCPRNCCNSYQLGKIVPEKKEAVIELQRQVEKFQELTVPLDQHADYIHELSENIYSLRTAMEELKNAYEDVKERVEREEKLQKKRTHVVDGWIHTVEDMEKDLNNLLSNADEEIQKKRLGISNPGENFCDIYELGKMVVKKKDAVTELRSRAENFLEVAVPMPAPPVMERPLNTTVGLDSLSEEVWSYLEDDQVGIIGIHGMGGVGKTTLLRRINNEFSNTSFQFDVVIWVLVSQKPQLEKIQEIVLNKLDIPDYRWKGKSEDEKATEIYNALRKMKFVLLLDDIWEPLDLLKIGVPPLKDRNESKVVFTTRDLNVCEAMGADRIIKVKCLGFDEAFILFKIVVGEDTLNSHPSVPDLAKIVTQECKGLPLALVIAGGAMKGKKTRQEWEKNIELLKSYPAKVAGMENDVFRVLAFSYDNLGKDNIKSCFLYCSMFPEDCEIPHKQLIELWIGEGFLDDCHRTDDARTEGEDIIKNLKLACLLESCESQKHVKMHDVIRDMALWLARENGEKKNKIVVKEPGRLIEYHEIAEWHEAQRISLWDNSIEEDFAEPQNFPNLQSLLASGESLYSFPSKFLAYMPSIRVLDLSNSELMKLPAEISKLFTLQYLNLSKTEIDKLPIELKNLTNLRCLILDDMEKLEIIPPEMISGLSSLQLFSVYASIGCNGDWGSLLEELERLKHVSEISIPLRSVRHTQKSIKSHKLRRSIRRLSLQECTAMTSVELSPYLQILQLWRCLELKEVKINLEKGSRNGFTKLCEVEIISCPNLLNLACLVYARNLVSLHVENCESMKKVIEDEEIQVSDVFSVLTTLSLSHLPKLESIYGGALSFPSLREMNVKRCASLRKLPFDSNTNCLQKIEGEQYWWDGLQWEPQNFKHKFTQFFVPK